MVSLVNRASPQQARIMRIIMGAVKNAVDAHPEWGTLDTRLPASIAKRATGTLTAQWPEVLAAKPSDQPGASGKHRAGARLVGRERGAPSLVRRSPSLKVQIGMMAREARREGKQERLEALVDVLRMIS